MEAVSFVSIGCPGRPLATREPTLDDLLPADDAQWDQGIVANIDSHKISSPTTNHMSKFALLCQAARLLGQVLHQLSNRTPEHDHGDDTWMQLDRTLESMLTAALDFDSPDYDQITFIYKQVTLYRSSGKSSANAETLFVVEGITHTIRTSLLEQQCLVGRDPESVSPWGLFFGYRICVYYACSDQKEAYALQIVDSLKEVFRNIEVRWNAAGKLFSGYLFIVAGIDHYSQVSTFGFWKHTRS
ncbi:uncharacterized protein PV06_07511 [Exophiala oligosperma]|uniref:Uncharacterized protein n=1 Tax=Exophiala oligosperma TaxID=215243 RepID=A0A0D2DXP3_9EURO|nr:uncharacterized protein PV06_07511 [Exophiala oligosperma]KIW40304.1 hypothetical protein PV06_07511 [Exophiala oligosperma]